ncbi:MAG: hypothetical protein CK528_12630 [Alcaligenaceae bacterium]|nr:MAG: hypothetical protein CK528_12630 [Alcaligenaceae bacterium]
MVRGEVTDLEQYKAYVAANAAPLKKYGGRFLARGGQFEAPEGSSCSRNALIEFASYQAALDCYHSPEYQAAVKLRAPVSSLDMIIIEGYDGPQP